MKRRPGGLGRGLDALFPTRPGSHPGSPPAAADQPPGAGPAGPSAPEKTPTDVPTAPGGAPRPEQDVVAVPVEAIAPNPAQPRGRIAPEELADLAASVRVHGVLQPVIVARGDAGYVLIAGERRWRAAQLAGLASIPAVVKEVTPRERLELALVENVQRQDLTPLEEAAAYRQLIAEHGLTQEAVATRVGKSRVAVANALRLLHLAPAVHAALADGRISAGHARALLGAPDAASQAALLERVLAEALSVRATEEAVRRGAPLPTQAPAPGAAGTPPAGESAAGHEAARAAAPDTASTAGRATEPARPPGAIAPDPATGRPALAAPVPGAAGRKADTAGPGTSGEARADAGSAAAARGGVSGGMATGDAADSVVADAPGAPADAPGAAPAPGLATAGARGTVRERTARPASADVAAVEQELRAALGTKVELRRSRRGGRIVIHFFSDDELQGLYERLIQSG